MFENFSKQKVMKIKNKNTIFFLIFVLFCNEELNLEHLQPNILQQILSNSLAKVRLLVWHRASKECKQDIDTETGNRRPLGILSCCRSDTNGCFHLSVCILPLLFFQKSFCDIVTYPGKKRKKKKKKKKKRSSALQTIIIIVAFCDR